MRGWVWENTGWVYESIGVRRLVEESEGERVVVGEYRVGVGEYRDEKADGGEQG